METIEKKRKPKWLKVKLPTGDAYRKVRAITTAKKLHTICESGNCPNMGECWGAGTLIHLPRPMVKVKGKLEN